MRLLRFVAHQPRWLLGLILFGFTLTMGLILLGEKGNAAAGPLSLLVAIIALGLAILFRPGSRYVSRPQVDRRAVVIVASVLVLMLSPG